MSQFSGNMSNGSTKTGRNKGIMRVRKEQKRIEAHERQQEFDDAVARIAQEQNIGIKEARDIAARSRRFDRQMAERR